MLSRDLIRVAARHAAIEMALAGVTLVADMYYHEDEVARAVAEVGIRGVLGKTVIGFPVVDAPEPWGGLAYAEGFIQEWKDHPLITPAVAPHAPYTVPPEWLLKSKALADLVVVDVHAANMQPVYDPYAALDGAAYPENVRSTVVNGRVVVRDRLVQTADLEAHEREWRPLQKRVAQFARTLE